MFDKWYIISHLFTGFSVFFSRKQEIENFLSIYNVNFILLSGWQDNTNKLAVLSQAISMQHWSCQIASLQTKKLLWQENIRETATFVY